MEWALLALGVALGGVVGWLVASSRAAQRAAAAQVEAEGRIKAAESLAQALRAQVEEQQRGAAQLQEKIRAESELKAAAEARLQEALASVEEQKKLLDEARQKLADSFNALAAEALKSNNQAFLQLARSTFETLQEQSKGDLEKRQQAVEGLVTPLREALARYEKQIVEMEHARQKAYGSLEEQLRGLGQANQRLLEEATHLANALSSPLKVRGRWGELTLRRVAELAGMSEFCDFTEQETVSTESGRQRPDMIVNLPGGRRIAVDAKVPLQAFIAAADPEASDEQKAESLKTHGKLLRTHMNQLADRKYWEQVGPELQLVVLFLPGDSFLSAALEQDRELVEDGLKRNILLATPSTLIALLRSAAYLWQQEKVAQNARKVGELGRELNDRLRSFLGHFQSIGTSIGRAVEAYNKSVGSLESRVLPSVRKFRELGAAPGEPIGEVESIEATPRVFVAAEHEPAVRVELPDSEGQNDESD